MSAATHRLALLALLALAPAPAPAGEEHPDCAPLAAVLDQAPTRYASLAGT